MVLSESVSDDEADEEDNEEDGELERERFLFQMYFAFGQSSVIDFDLDDAMMATVYQSKTGSKALESERLPVSSTGLSSIVPSIVNIYLSS